VPADLQTRIERTQCANKPSLEENTLVYGEFATRGQRDWMAVCAFDGPQWLLFHHWGGPARCQGDGVAFPRQMTLAKSPAPALRSLARAYGREVPPLDHDGLVQVDEIETVTLYCSGGRWTVVAQQRNLDSETRAAVERLVRAAPGGFPQVPQRIRDRMTADGCRIPRRLVGTGFNLISGEFARRGQKDWAVICSGAVRWAIRVYWGGASRCGPLDRAGDNADLLDEWEIRTMSAARLLDAQAAHPDPGSRRLSQITHDAIYFGNEKGSTAYYCLAGKWAAILTGD